LLLGASLGFASTLNAQDSSVAQIRYPLRQRVKVVAPALSPKPIIGRIDNVDSARLSLSVTSKGSVLDIPLADVTALSASGGIDRAKGARRGALVGLAFGAWFFADAYREIERDDYFGLGVLSLGVVAFGITPSIGALAGFGLAPERWDAVPIPRSSTSFRSAASIRFAPGEDVRVIANGRKLSGRVQSQTTDLLALANDDGQVSVRWRDISALSVRGEPSRRRGAVRGAIIVTGITAIGVATDPLPTVLENAGVMVGNAAFGALIGAFFPMRGRTALPVPR
jgi:hypothetical protein